MAREERGERRDRRRAAKAERAAFSTARRLIESHLRLEGRPSDVEAYRSGCAEVADSIRSQLRSCLEEGKWLERADVVLRLESCRETRALAALASFVEHGVDDVVGGGFAEEVIRLGLRSDKADVRADAFVTAGRYEEAYRTGTLIEDLIRSIEQCEYPEELMVGAIVMSFLEPDERVLRSLVGLLSVETEEPGESMPYPWWAAQGVGGAPALLHDFVRRQDHLRWHPMLGHQVVSLPPLEQVVTAALARRGVKLEVVQRILDDEPLGAPPWCDQIDPSYREVRHNQIRKMLKARGG